MLAATRIAKLGGQTLYLRVYPAHGLAAHVVGYSTLARSRAGIERSENDYLTASNGNLNTAFRTTLDRLRGVTVTGNNVVLTIDVKAQKVAESLLRGLCGAAVVLEPSTGKVLALASSPGYDPNLVETNFARAERAPGYKCGAPLLDRATQGLYPPGSTFKVVTATAALDTGAFKPDSVFQDPGYCVEYGKHVSNAGNADQSGPEAFGRLTLAQGLQHSVNSVYCNVGKQIGAKVILEYAKRFGFYSVPPIETPPAERSASGLYDKSHKLWYPRNPALDVDPGRLAFGQERMLVTPLQMAMIAATVANGGVLMKPYLVQRITSPSGSTITTTRPERLDRVMKPQTAAELTQMMISVVEGGTGTAARIPGVQVAGKTGTAETGINNVYVPWFIALAPADHPKLAVAVVVENTYRGFGGSVAAPIARQILQAMLAGR